MTVAEAVEQLRRLRHRAAILAYLSNHARCEFLAGDLGDAERNIQMGTAIEPAQPEAVEDVLELLNTEAAALDAQAQVLLRAAVRQSPNKVPVDGEAANRGAQLGVVDASLDSAARKGGR